MQNNIETELTEGYQVLITGIKWNPETTKVYASKKNNDELPEQFALDIPRNVLNQAMKKQNSFNDIIETFVYNFLTRKHEHEVYHCQIWLPLEDPAEFAKAQ